MIITILKIIAKTILYFFIIAIFIVTIEYIICPIYTFKTGEPFRGNYFYNPYSAMDSSNWRKANFQVQSYAWSGITSGRGNTNEEIYNVYKSLNYDIIATSDYQKINRFRAGESSYIPVYEHGYGIKKNHHVLIGAEKVLWTDYPLFQTLHNKQHILNLLGKDNELIYIAHPKLRNAFKPEDMRLLANYDGIEVLNNYRTSIKHWDTALSSGNYVTIIGNDDAHDISNPDEIGHHCTYINSPSTKKEDIISALKLGNAFGAEIFRPNGESFEAKTKRIRILPVIKQIEIISDTLFIRTDSLAKEIRFIGQDGKLLKTSKLTNDTFYKIKKEDPYVRMEIEFLSRSVYYLNAVCRYDGKNPQKFAVPKIDFYRTLILRIIGFSTLIFIIINFVLLRKRLKRRKGRE
ncbi:MAG: hypothetical protein B6D61_03095 [Bacteroidetes bacterium 4484_249]|nr:MAG: hypothetical protein B6D61_03095 [Bacteroidetes bacterium 4484_249]